MWDNGVYKCIWILLCNLRHRMAEVLKHHHVYLKLPFSNPNCHFLSLFRPPVGDVVVVPFEVSVEGLVAANVWDPTAGAFHDVQRGLVQQSGLLQTHPLLQRLQSFGRGHEGLEAAALQSLQVAKPLQVFLVVENTNTHAN